jgi:hypothetical protein
VFEFGKPPCLLLAPFLSIHTFDYRNMQERTSYTPAIRRYFAVLGVMAMLVAVASRYPLVKYGGSPRSMPVLAIESEENEENSDLTLTIAIDHAGSCPKGCAFMHLILPPHIRYRYVEIDKLNDEEFGHLLLVARKDAKALSQISLAQRARGYSVGLFLMADEKLNGNGFGKYYPDFDYVLRHYYTSKEKDWLALGNLTCGSSKLSLPIKNIGTTKAPLPRWGIHWVFLPTSPAKLGLQSLNARPAASVWPVGKRAVNCSFIGRLTPARSELKDALAASDLDCDISFTTGFMEGEDHWDYVHSLTRTKIGLVPPGNNNETHRLAEILENGVIPAMLNSDFLYAPFRRVPGIVADNWTSVIEEMRRLLHGGETVSEVEAIQQDASQFYEDLKRCMSQDLDFILSGVFREAKEQSQLRGG